LPVAELLGGVETGGTWCVCALGTGPEELEATDQFRTGEPGPTLDRIAQFFAGGPAPAAVGIGSFGPVNLDPNSPAWGHVLGSTPKRAWANAPVGPALRDRLGVPVAFDTDVNAAAMGEQRWGAGRDVDSLCYLTVGTGIGGGLLIEGRPVHGLVHPEVGHLRVPRNPDDSFAGACPIHGDCWEGLASGPAIAKRWGASAEELPDEHPGWALEAEYVALGILGIVCVASPQRVIVGGGVMQRAGLLAMVRTRLRELLAGYLDTPLLDDRVDEYVVTPELGDRAGVLGAIALAADASADSARAPG
jgi:fructokinase